MRDVGNDEFDIMMGEGVRLPPLPPAVTAAAAALLLPFLPPPPPPPPPCASGSFEEEEDDDDDVEVGGGSKPQLRKTDWENRSMSLSVTSHRVATSAGLWRRSC